MSRDILKLLALLLKIAYTTTIFLFSLIFWALIFCIFLIFASLIFASLILLLNNLIPFPFLLFPSLAVGFSILFTIAIYEPEYINSNNGEINKSRPFTDEESYLIHKDTMHFNSLNQNDNSASSKKIIEWSSKQTLVQSFQLFFAEEIIASFFTRFKRHLYQIGIAYQNNTKKFIKQKISKETHDNTFSVKVSNKSQLPTFTIESYFNLFFILKLYEHRNLISDIIKFPKIYSNFKMNAYHNILRPLTRRIDLTNYFGNPFYNVPLNKILLQVSFDSEDQSNKISVDRMPSSTLSYHRFNRTIWTPKIINNPFKEIRNQVNVEKVDSLSFLDISKDDLNDDWELFANNIINAPSETIKVQYENLDYKNESDTDEQIDNRILEIQQDINVTRDKIKGEYNDFNIFYTNMRNEVTNLSEKIITENTKLNVRLCGPTAYEIGIKEVTYSRKNRIKFPGRIK